MEANNLMKYKIKVQKRDAGWRWLVKSDRITYHSPYFATSEEAVKNAKDFFSSKDTKKNVN